MLHLPVYPGLPSWVCASCNRWLPGVPIRELQLVRPPRERPSALTFEGAIHVVTTEFADLLLGNVPAGSLEFGKVNVGGREVDGWSWMRPLNEAVVTWEKSLADEICRLCGRRGTAGTGMCCVETPVLEEVGIYQVEWYLLVRKRITDMMAARRWRFYSQVVFSSVGPGTGLHDSVLTNQEDCRSGSMGGELATEALVRGVRFWGEDGTLGLSEIEGAQSAMGLQLPDLLRELYASTNGGDPDKCAIDIADDGLVYVRFLPLTSFRDGVLTVMMARDELVARHPEMRGLLPFAITDEGRLLLVNCVSGVSDVFVCDGGEVAGDNCRLLFPTLTRLWTALTMD